MCSGLRERFYYREREREKVLYYRPAGNFIGSYSENVFPLK
jgi:hypothetical protein